MHTILIVDDHSEIRRLLRIAAGNDVTILEAQDGATALAMVQQHRPKAVFLDVMMPGPMDGFEVLAAIRADPDTRHTLVAMTTARSQAADHEQAHTHKADAYFTKPFSPLKVSNWLREQLHQG
jgi:CheY-like chemotaxis protein